MDLRIGWRLWVSGLLADLAQELLSFSAGFLASLVMRGFVEETCDCRRWEALLLGDIDRVGSEGVEEDIMIDIVQPSVLLQRFLYATASAYTEKKISGTKTCDSQLKNWSHAINVSKSRAKQNQDLGNFTPDRMPIWCGNIERNLASRNKQQKQQTWPPEVNKS